MVGPNKEKPLPLFSVLEWIAILCSSLCCGCFGKIWHPQRPAAPLIIQSEGDSLSRPHQYILSTRPLNHSHDESETVAAARYDSETVSLDNEHVGSEHGDDDGRMFHGVFIMGSRVLTEVELQSPIEETIVLATPIRTPQRSNPSSAASSTRQLHDDSYQVCIGDIDQGVLDVKNCSPSASSALSVHADRDKIHITPPYKLASLLDSREYRSCSVLCKKSKENELLLVEEDMEASHNPFQSIKHCVRRNNFWNDKQTQVVGSLSECGTLTRSSARRINHASAVKGDRQCWTYQREESPLQSLPGFGNSLNSSSERQERDDVGRRRSRSLTDQDFTEVKGCIDLGFVFTQDHIANLRKTLPALEVCYAVANGAISPACTSEDSKSLSPGSPPISPWRIASSGDQPNQVKARLRHWAQAVACNVRQGC